MKHKKFNYRSLEELTHEINQAGLNLKVSQNMDVFKQKIKVGDVIIPNALASHPMEGGDANEDGSPSELTFRKYKEIAKGGVGLIWIEAVSICQDGKSNPKQLAITEQNVHEFKKLNDTILESAKQEYGQGFKPVTIIQLNHSGRYSKPFGEKRPVIATHKPILDEKLGIDDEYPLVDDTYLENLEDEFIKAVLLCQQAGFTGVDLKACHGYLPAELLSAYNRQGKYGGPFEGRTTFMMNITDKIKSKMDISKFLIGVRLNLYDGVPYPQGWGVNEENPDQYDLKEPIKLVQQLVEKGVELINVTMGNPYLIPHINRPYDKGSYYPDETPLMSAYRLIAGAAEIQQNVPEAKVVGVGYSWFREFAPYIGAGSLENKFSTLIGFGRQSIAYPDFARDILNKGELVKSKVCVSCSKCAELKKEVWTCGCVIRDSEIYLPIYEEMLKKRGL